MVQRKVVPHKFGIETHHVKPEKLPTIMKPSSFQNPDGKNRGGADLKKKMKKSRSIKLSEIQSLKKLSPLVSPITAATPKKQPVMKISDGSPNYMKSTSSSEARKERYQVSPHDSNKSTFRSGSGHKSAKSVTKSSNLKLVRTLTKTTSFKHARITAKKCSPIALCVDINAERATCSSTLKDSKFPAYIMLNPGGTESEGTSAMKVCPYTYCSLNGHHRTPSPPLKCFLSARRGLLKTQKSIKIKEIDTGQLFFYEKIENEEVGSYPLKKEMGMDFFVKVYAKNRENDGEKSTYNEDNEEKKLESLKDKAREHCVGKVAQSMLYDDSSLSAPEAEENFDVISMTGTEINSNRDVEFSADEATDMEMCEGGEYSLPESDSECELEVGYLTDTVEPSDKILGNFDDGTLANDVQEICEVEVADNAETQDQPISEEAKRSNAIKDQNQLEKDEGENIKLNISHSQHSDEQKVATMKMSSLEENCTGEINKIHSDLNSQEPRHEMSNAGSFTGKELINSCNSVKGRSKCRRTIDEEEELRGFNPREPNYLPIEPQPEAEKVDLRHQTTDERKNAEEWMVDYALRQTVNKLAPARKKRVALLVEAFETVMPIPKLEKHMGHSKTSTTQARLIPACS